jgi:hypothetical protein
MSVLSLALFACGSGLGAFDTRAEDSGEPNVLETGSPEPPIDSAESGVGCRDDADGDGWCAEEDDCDDFDPDVHPDATEACDAIDNDCDGLFDEGLLATYYADADADGYGAPDGAAALCSWESGYADNGADCDDGDADVHPGVSDDVADGVDDDCDGDVDEDYVPFDVTVTWDAVGVSLSIAGMAPSWELGMAETGPGEVGWFGETCIVGDEPWGYPDYAYDICHPLDASGGDLPSIYPDITLVADDVTLFNEDIGNGGAITYVLFDTASTDCWVFGDDVTYYADFGCTPA